MPPPVGEDRRLVGDLMISTGVSSQKRCSTRFRTVHAGEPTRGHDASTMNSATPGTKLVIRIETGMTCETTTASAAPTISQFSRYCTDRRARSGTDGRVTDITVSSDSRP